MPELKLIPVAAIEPPDNPMRQESTRGEDWEDFKESIAVVLLQPIGVRDLGPEPSLGQWVGDEGAPSVSGEAVHSYKLIWGMRRTLAHRELGKEVIQAVVFGVGEQADEETFMAHENFHREDLNLAEEARYYKRLADKFAISTAEVARRCRRPYSRVSRLLATLSGDPDILDALRIGRISQAQADELNQVKDAEGRRQMLHYSSENGLSAQFVRRWREQREASGMDVGMKQVEQTIKDYRAPDYRTQARCEIDSKWVGQEEAMPRIICLEHWQMLGEAFTCLEKYLKGELVEAVSNGKEG